MRERFVFGRGAVALVVLLAVGWLAGGLVQWILAANTGYGDIVPPLMLLGLLLCAGAGALLRLIDAGGTLRAGVLAGIAMAATLVAAYALLMFLALGPDRFVQGDGETWWSLLIELPFWLGIPTLISAAVGGLGWLTADRLGGHGTTAPHAG
jgi:hypothetical protein